MPRTNQDHHHGSRPFIYPELLYLHIVALLPEARNSFFLRFEKIKFKVLTFIYDFN